MISIVCKYRPILVVHQIYRAAWVGAFNGSKAIQPLTFPLSTIYKMSGRFLSVYKDTSASHEYLCTLIKNGHEFCNYLQNALK